MVPIDTDPLEIVDLETRNRPQASSLAEEVTNYRTCKVG